MAMRLLLIVGYISVAQAMCADEWTSFPGGCLRVFVDDKMNHNDASIQCNRIRHDGRLLALALPLCPLNRNRKGETLLWINGTFEHDGYVSCYVSRSKTEDESTHLCLALANCDSSLGYVCVIGIPEDQSTTPVSTTESTLPPPTTTTTTLPSKRTILPAPTRSTSPAARSRFPTTSRDITITSSITGGDDGTDVVTSSPSDQLVDVKPHKQNKSNLGLPVGLAVGGVILVVLVTVVVVFVVRKQRKSPASQPDLPMSGNIAAANTVLHENHVYTSLLRDQEGTLPSEPARPEPVRPEPCTVPRAQRPPVVPTTATEGNGHVTVCQKACWETR